MQYRISSILSEGICFGKIKKISVNKANVIDNYTGSQRQNDELLRLLKEGKLRT